MKRKSERVPLLINELFLALHTSYPGYLAEHFGMSSE